VRLGFAVTNRSRLGSGVTAGRDQSENVASILSRRARLLGLMWDLDNTPLWVLYGQCAGCAGAVGCPRRGRAGTGHCGLRG
jgi:hypothetical protein